MGELGRVAETGVFRAAEAFFKDGETALARPPGQWSAWSPLPPDIKDELALAGTAGREALETMKRYDMRIVFTDSGGCMFARDTNTMYVDTTKGSATTILLHETTHGRWWHEGRSAHPADLSRDGFIGRSMDEEIDAAVNEISGYLELRKNGIVAPAPPLYREYEHGFATSVMQEGDVALSAGGFLPWAERQRVGHEGGTAAVKTAYYSGEVRSSVSGRPYIDTFGERWDDYHRAG